MANAKFYTYIHKKADTGEVFYVGKGKPGRQNNRFGRSRHWASVVAKHGLLVSLVASFWDEAAALAHECELIAQYRLDGVQLVNLTNGGEGTSGFTHSAETIRKIGIANTGKKRSAEICAKMSKAMTGRIVGPPSAEHKAKISKTNTGKKHLPETCLKMSEMATGRRHSQRTKEKISALLTGRAVSEQTRMKLSATHTGRVISKEHGDKISAAKKGVKTGPQKNPKTTISDEHRAKVSAAMTRIWAERRMSLE